MSEAWYFALIIPTGFMAGWYSAYAIDWVKTKISNRPGGD